MDEVWAGEGEVYLDLSSVCDNGADRIGLSPALDPDTGAKRGVSGTRADCKLPPPCTALIVYCGGLVQAL